MKRATASLDRTGTAVVGLALIALGGGAIAWERGELPGRERLDAAFVDTAVDAGWWPWALGVAAVVLILLGLWWLLAHLPRRSVGTVAFGSTSADVTNVDGEQVDGRLSVDLGTAARSAAKSLAGHDGIVSASGRSVSDRGQRVVEIVATLDPAVTSLEQVSDAAARTRDDIVTSLDGTPAKVRILLQCGKSRKQSARVS
ncbi:MULTISPECIES: hypothetical protein [Nocardiaceae]|mgnify:CR=1 FL=1|uniref:Unannotated protein n=1 Tax=freshwater metagenome TaxID=449393 RepID=A0A6J7H0R6_9ZZZZ|nr:MULTISPECIES: hypothetical protein [Rhodococcus]MDP9637792.1 hypothetical protein [Rhodococcus cercidiphylli]MSX07440.1 hypothetical protein [Actinomycetota bacterium]KJV01672.1 putative membrane protein [Rhodococcus sp. PML026]MBW4779791.1 hypothetical protein [Rhodococcus fascians]MBY4014073.1 hypothetical protein [Rhodococcus fascians]